MFIATNVVNLNKQLTNAGQTATFQELQQVISSQFQQLSLEPQNFLQGD